MDGPHRLTRRQALRLGAGAAALGALRVPSPAFGATPTLFELALPDAHAHAASAGWRTTDVLQAPRRFDLAGLRWSRASGYQAQIRTRPHGGRWTRWTAAPRPATARVGRHRPRLHGRRRRAPAALTRRRRAA